jgi:hypothetical protein
VSINKLYNLILIRKGDLGVEIDEEKFEKYKLLTNKLVDQYGSLNGKRTN